VRMRRRRTVNEERRPHPRAAFPTLRGDLIRVLRGADVLSAWRAPRSGVSGSGPKPAIERPSRFLDRRARYAASAEARRGASPVNVWLLAPVIRTGTICPARAAPVK